MPDQEEQVKEEVQEEQPQDNQEATVSTAEEETPSKDRTKEQFEKLTDNNKKLNQENKKYKDLLSSLRPDKSQEQPKKTPTEIEGAQQQQYQQPISAPPSAQNFSNLNQQQVNNVFQSMVDQEGYLDGNKLMTTLQQMDGRAAQAEQRAQRAEQAVQDMRKTQEEFEVSSTMKSVHEKYPQLDPESDQFDENYYDLVRNEMIGQIMEKGKEDPMKAAQKLYNSFYKDKEMGKKEDAQRKQTQEVKKTANTVRPRSSSMKGYYTNDEESQILEGVRQGKKGALAEMLKRRGQ